MSWCVGISFYSLLRSLRLLLRLLHILRKFSWVPMCPQTHSYRCLPHRTIPSASHRRYSWPTWLAVMSSWSAKNDRPNWSEANQCLNRRAAWTLSSHPFSLHNRLLWLVSLSKSWSGSHIDQGVGRGQPIVLADVVMIVARVVVFTKRIQDCFLPKWSYAYPDSAMIVMKWNFYRVVLLCLIKQNIWTQKLRKVYCFKRLWSERNNWIWLHLFIKGETYPSGHATQ